MKGKRSHHRAIDMGRGEERREEGRDARDEGREQARVWGRAME